MIANTHSPILRILENALHQDNTGHNCRVQKGQQFSKIRRPNNPPESICRALMLWQRMVIHSRWVLGIDWSRIATVSCNLARERFPSCLSTQRCAVHCLLINMLSDQERLSTAIHDCLFGILRKAWANEDADCSGRFGFLVCKLTNGSEGSPPVFEQSSRANVTDEERCRFVRLSCAHVSLS